MSEPSNDFDLKKEKEKKDAAMEGNKRYCKMCKHEISPRFECTCKGKPGSGSGGGSSDEIPSPQKLIETPDNKISLDIKDEEFLDVNNVADALEILMSIEDIAAENFDPAIIAILLANEILVIQNDRENGKLSVQFDLNKLCELPNLKENVDQINKFIKFIENQFDAFKKLHPDVNQNLLNKEIKTYSVGGKQINSLVIKIGITKLYDNFIQQLTSAINHLATSQNQTAINLIATLLQDQTKLSKETNPKQTYLNSKINNLSEQKTELSSYKTPTPLSTELKPKGFDN